MRLFLPLAFFITLQAASAATITLSPTNYGFALGNGTTVSGNYASGWFGNSNEEIRQFFVFDRSSISGTITAAALRLQLGSSSTSGYVSPDASETWQLFDVSTPIANLIAGSGGAAAFADLASGTSLGSLSVLKTNDDSIVTLSLDANGLTYLNSKSNSFAIGGVLTTLTKTNGVNEAIFNSSGSPGNTRELFITYTPTSESTVPEPSTCFLLVSGLATLAATRKRT